MNETYERLIDYAIEVCQEFTLVCWSDVLSETANCVLNELNDYLIEIKEQQSWPGTNLFQGYTKVYYYHLNDITKEVLKNHATSLYSWVEPKLLEDLTFFKKDRKPWLISIAHEHFSWIDNYTTNELATLILIKGILVEEQK